MKQIVAILLLGVLTFNWFGYRALSRFLQNRAASEMQARIDKNDFNRSQLIEIRIPLNLPYLTDWSDFERYDGTIDLSGKHYRYVGRKIEKGDLVLLCLPDNSRNRLEKAQNNFFKLVNDLQQASGSPGSSPANTAGAFKNFMTDFWETPMHWGIVAPDTQKDHPYVFDMTLFDSWFGEMPGQPPERRNFTC